MHFGLRPEWRTGIRINRMDDVGGEADDNSIK